MALLNLIRQPLTRVGALALALTTLLLTAAGAPRPVHAAGIVVNTLADANPPATDGLCSLREAITNANTNAATYPDCPAGAGADAITFSVSGTIVLAAALPDITDGAALTIDGNGQSLTVSGNKAVRPFAVAFEATLTLTSVSIIQGKDSIHAGALENSGTTHLIGGGVSESSGGVFGAAVNNAGIMTVRSSSIANNTSSDIASSGGIYNTGALLLLSSTISGNNGTLSGGIRNSNSLLIVNSTVSGNSAGESNAPGAIDNVYNLSIIHSTITDNKGGYNGVGGIRNSGTLTIVNSIVAKNYGQGEAQDCEGPWITTGPNLVGLLSPGCQVTGPSPITGDPVLGPLLANGGPTRTHAPLPPSPALDKGDLGVCTAQPVASLDQQGRPRPLGGGCDLGAFEVDPSVPVLSVVGPTHVEGDAGTSVMDFVLSLSTPPTTTVTVHYLTRDGTALSGQDYVAHPSTNLQFTPGVTSRVISVQVLGDSLPEFTESLMVEVSITGNALLATPIALGTIVDNDHPLGFVVNDLSDDADVTREGLCLTAAGRCTLRAAMQEADYWSVTKQIITFSISGKIELNAPLPTVTDGSGLTIDGSGHTISIDGRNLLRPFLIEKSGHLELIAIHIVNGYGKSGGALLNRGTLDLRKVTLLNNAAFFAFYLEGGGALMNEGGLANVEDSHISMNTSEGRGGGIFNAQGTLRIKNSTIDRNGSKGLYFLEGGGIASHSGDLSVVSSTVSSNIAQAGGGISVLFGKASIQASTISGNYASSTAGGGGLRNSGGMVEVTNTTISGNYVPEVGGGIYNEQRWESVLIVNTSTIADNGAGVAGGGVWSLPPATLYIGNSVLSNAAPSRPDCGELVAPIANLIRDPSGCTITGTPPITGNPLLAPLADNGGPTKTHGLLPGSPALNAGDPAVCAAAPVSGVDQRGVVRPQGPGCDLGAYESALVSSVVGGKNLRISSPGSVGLAWDGGTAQTGYTLLRYNTVSGVADLFPLAAAATSYTDATVLPGLITCYILAATDSSGLLGLSDLECALPGMAAGTVIPAGFTLALNQTTNASLTWSPAPGGADAYLSVRIPLDGSAVAITPLPGTATASLETAGTAGACFQLAAYRGSELGYTSILCGIPGVSTLGAAGGRVTSVADAAEALEQALGPVRERLANVVTQASAAVRR